jgi:phosphatidylserine decarboxylase
VNIFLHNNDYHRLHSPIDGKVERVEHVEGELVVLRPWIYPENPSIPAFRNERMNLMMREKGTEELWFLSIIGGPAVGGIRLEEKVEQKSELVVGEELGTFLLGSTLCMAAPIEESIQEDQYRVSPGASIGDG